MATGGGLASADEAPSPTYGQELEFIQKHAPDAIELVAGDGQARAVVCPSWQGRVMTSTCKGLDGISHGWVNRAFIEAGEPSQAFNNYGGEDRFWLSPEAGQFALFFAAGQPQTLDHWQTPPGLNQGAFAAQQQDDRIRMARRIELVNYSGSKFDLDVSRVVRLLGAAEFGELFGKAAADALAAGGISLVGFETDNTITNRGPATSQESGLVSIWTLGQFPPGPETVIVAPYVAGPEKQLGPIATTDYFGPVPAERLAITDQAVLFLGDGRHRSKLGISPRRARPQAGSIDFARGVLTLVHFSLPADVSGARWLNNTWVLPQADPLAGDAFNSYNDGPPEPGAATLGGFYELETLSPGRPLVTGESLAHVHRTFHLEGEPAALARVALAVLGVDLETVRKTMNLPGP